MNMLTSGLESFFWFVIVLGIMIFVHEFGHFMVAKLLRISVEVFSLGFGPRLLGWKLGETDYRICLLPLGGYVRLTGENPDEELSGDRNEFLSRPKWQRSLVFLMGPLLNIALAVIVLAASFTIGISVDASLEMPPVVEWIEEGSPAADADIQLGDRILEVKGKQVSVWGDVQLYTTLNGDRPLMLAVDRNGEVLERTLTPIVTPESVIPRLGLRPRLPAVMSNLEEGAPAKTAGFQEMDTIVRIDDTVIADIEQAIRIIHGSPGKELAITVLRDGREITRNAIPANKDGKGMIGFQPYFPEEIRKLSLLPAIRKSLQTNYEQGFLLFRIIKMMFQGEVSMKTVSGPIEIATYSKKAARTGTLFPFIAFISLQLGIINLLPIPVLDGGHLFIMLLEGATRRDFSLRLKERVMQVGVILLFTLMFLVIVNDLSKVPAINRLIPW